MSPGPVFVDRLHERGILDSMLGAAEKGTSGAIVVYGDADSWTSSPSSI